MLLSWYPVLVRPPRSAQSIRHHTIDHVRWPGSSSGCKIWGISQPAEQNQPLVPSAPWLLLLLCWANFTLPECTYKKKTTKKQTPTHTLQRLLLDFTFIPFWVDYLKLRWASPVFFHQGWVWIQGLHPSKCLYFVFFVFLKDSIKDPANKKKNTHIFLPTNEGGWSS